MEAETKICIKCGDPKLLKDFNKNKKALDNLRTECKECQKKYYRENIDNVKKWQKIYRSKHKGKTKIFNENYRKNNPEKIKKYLKSYNKRNKEKIKIQTSEYRKNHRKEINNYLKNKKENDPVFKLNNNISNGIRKSLKSNKNGRKWETLVGYDTRELKEHLEAQFKDGMTWKNYGKWHIDHKIPISLFNITGVKSKGFKKAWELENLQPLWEKDNLSKRDKLFVL